MSLADKKMPPDRPAGLPGDLSVLVGNKSYSIIPSDIHPQSTRDARSKVMGYDDRNMQMTDDFKYQQLSSGKWIRLLRLKPGFYENTTIECELIDVEYTEKYELPVLGQDSQQNYEALSWCWGTGNRDRALLITRGENIYKMKVTRELALALKYLRHKNRNRLLWIDAICIDQENTQERNHQVQMMSLIYTKASGVCVWLGEDDDDSNLAIQFVKEDILNFENFDAVCSNKKNADKWRALLMLMQRPWFSRRWVVQEIALAQKATIYCGPDIIAWDDFAVAVELFVEVETATHRLSEVIQKDERFYHVPGWFEYVSQLGASLLVSATGKIFRRYKPRKYTADQRGLQSLEYLVSSLFTFEASEPRDVIYSLLAIARDTTPLADVRSALDRSDDEARLTKILSTFIVQKPYSVDYDLPYSEVCANFVQFCVERTRATDPSRALDIICRPWAIALDPKKEKKRRRTKGRSTAPLCAQRSSFHIIKKSAVNDRELVPHSPNDIRRSDSASEDPVSEGPSGDATFPPNTSEKASNRGHSVKLSPGDVEDGIDGNSQYEKTKTEPARTKAEAPVWEKKDLKLENLDRLPREKDNRENKQYWKEAIEKAIRHHGLQGDESEKCGVRKEILKHFPFPIPEPDVNSEQPPDIALPSWIGTLDRAPYALFRNPGIANVKKMGRRHADPLVGLPEDGQRNYTAAQTKSPDFTKLKFRKRKDHFSLFAKGFILGRVDKVGPPSQNGAVPQGWFKKELGGWEAVLEEDGHNKEPPEAFWRTLVADRGNDNRNPPYYYARACAESVAKGGLLGGAVSTTELIHNERNSIIAEYCRRVQAVIWNRKLVKIVLEGNVVDDNDNNDNNEKDSDNEDKDKDKEALGLVPDSVEKGDLVCILYGCTVPVVLRQSPKKLPQDLEDEKFQDLGEYLRKQARNLEQVRLRRARYAELAKSKWKEDEMEEIRTLTESTRDEMRRWAEEERADKKRKEDSKKLMAEAVKKSIEAVENIRKTNDGPTVDGQVNGKAERRSSYVETSRTPRPSVSVSDRSRTMEINPSLRDQRAQQAEKDDPYFWYQLKGECYVHGMMDGAALKEQFYESLPEHVFEIR
ncbi:hypothetical protein JX266_006643 [Neoarthrinium moseri]|nr:hypothetical protein JX266_006643 [Neoarthrinium moseri]